MPLTSLDFVASLVRFRYSLPGCSPPVRITLERPAFGDFYFQAFNGSVSLSVAGYNYNSDWTPLLAGLSPTGMVASLAARSLAPELVKAEACTCPPRSESDQNGAVPRAQRCAKRRHRGGCRSKNKNITKRREQDRHPQFTTPRPIDAHQ